MLADPTRIQIPAIRIAVAISLGLVLGCGGGPSPPAEEPEPQRPPLPALPALVPGEPELALVGRPAGLLDAKAVRRVTDAAIAPELLDRFARRTGVDPTRVEEAVVAEYSRGLVVLARGPFPAEDVVRAAGQRMSSTRARASEPFVRRVGHLGTKRYDIVALADDVVCVGRGLVKPQVATLLSRVQDGRWPGDSAPALSTGEVRSLRERYREAPLRLHVPKPLELPPGYGTSLLLARERVLVAALRPASARELEVEVAMRGQFPDGAAKNFHALVKSVARSNMGGALGLAETLDTLRVRVAEQEAVLRMKLRADTLARGLRLLFVRDLEALLEGGATQ